MKNKKVALPMSVAFLAMAAMLGTQQAKIKRIEVDGLVKLDVVFAAKQEFSVTFQGDRVMVANMVLVEGREPTTSAMTVVQEASTTDTVRLFGGLWSGEVLEVVVVDDDGCSLNAESSEVYCKDVARINQSLADIFVLLLKLEAMPTEDAGASIETTRLVLVSEFGRRLAA